MCITNLLYQFVPVQWVVGFTDGEGCFNLDVHCNNTTKHKLQMQPEFVIVQHERDKALLEKLIPFFGCGSVTVNRKSKTSTRYMYRVKNIQHLAKYVIPFFDKYPLLTAKSKDYAIFREIVLKMASGYHTQSPKNFLEIVDLGIQLSQRSRPINSPKTQAQQQKRSKVDEHIALLREKVSKN